jgi:drug/metabolite transporter (DMT)-like permease
LFNNLAPVWVALVAWIFWREHLGWVFWAGLALTIAGVVVIFGERLFLSGQLNPGDGLAVLSSVFYAAYFLVTQRGREKIPTLPYIWLAGLFAAGMLLIATQLFGMPVTGYPPLSYLVFLAAGVISQVGGYFSIGYALGHLPASVVSPTLVAQPVLTMFLAIPMTGEMPQPGQWLGALAVVAGIYLVNRRAAASEAGSDEIIASG